MNVGHVIALLVGGWLAIRRRRVDLRRNAMAGAFLVSCLFLTSYAARLFVSGTHHYPRSGVWRAIYLGVLATHMTLAMAVPPPPPG